MQRPEAMERSGIGGASRGNRATFFDDGEALFDAKKTAIANARERVWVETFLFTPDETGRTTLELLSEAARRGCDVILLFDQVGSHVTSFGFYRPLLDAGGRVAIFNPLPPWRRYGRRLGSFIRHRDHRKTVVADGVGFCGGHNFSRSYMGPPPHSFYDMTLRLEGPCVRDVASVFLDSFRVAAGEVRQLPSPPPPLPDGVPVSVHAHDGTRNAGDLVQAYAELLNGARSRALLTLAYFAPDQLLLEPIVAAARRGVKVRLLTTGKSDVPPVRWAGRHSYDTLLAAGVRIYELQEPRLHAKAIVVDGESCLVGSFDVNTAQRRHVAEVAAIINDPRLARTMEEAFAATLHRSREVTAEERRGGRRLLAGPTEWLSYRLLRV